MVQPDGKAYASAVAGKHVGCLFPAGSANLDLSLYRWTGEAWAVVAKPARATGPEAVVHRGPAGQYLWLVVHRTGSADYTLRTRRP